MPVLVRNVAYFYSIEFQKRILLVVHLLVVLDKKHKPCTLADLDSIINADLPDPANTNTFDLLWCLRSPYATRQLLTSQIEVPISEPRDQDVRPQFQEARRCWMRSPTLPLANSCNCCKNISRLYPHKCISYSMRTCSFTCDTRKEFNMALPQHMIQKTRITCCCVTHLSIPSLLSLCCVVVEDHKKF